MITAHDHPGDRRGGYGERIGNEAHARETAHAERLRQHTAAMVLREGASCHAATAVSSRVLSCAIGLRVSTRRLAEPRCRARPPQSRSWRRARVGGRHHERGRDEHDDRAECHSRHVVADDLVAAVRRATGVRVRSGRAPQVPAPSRRGKHRVAEPERFRKIAVPVEGGEDARQSHRDCEDVDQRGSDWERDAGVAQPSSQSGRFVARAGPTRRSRRAVITARSYVRIRRRDERFRYVRITRTRRVGFTTTHRPRRPSRRIRVGAVGLAVGARDVVDQQAAAQEHDEQVDLLGRHSLTGAEHDVNDPSCGGRRGIE